MKFFYLKKRHLEFRFNGLPVFTAGLTALLLGAAGCSTTMEALSTVGTAVGEVSGAITPEQGESIRKSAVAVGKTFDSITPEQEYYIGRTVAATIINSYKPCTQPDAHEYINLLGQTLARFSSLPETFGGYHFLLMDTDEINAFAAPGGLIMISRGMLRCCKSEDALAAMLAHEIGHVQHRHGLQAIKKGRLTSALTILTTESAKSLAGEQLAELTQNFENTITDITATMVNSGYSRAFERQADQAAVAILKRSGYDPLALVDVLEAMQQQLKTDKRGFAKTHPDPESRIADIRKLIGNQQAPTASAARQARFASYVKALQ